MTAPPLVPPTSTISRETGAAIANYVREDAIAQALAVKDALVARGMTNMDIHIFFGQTIAERANNAKGYERGVIPVGRSCAGNGAQFDLCITISWHVAANLVSADWSKFEGE